MCESHRWLSIGISVDRNRESLCKMARLCTILLPLLFILLPSIHSVRHGFRPELLHASNDMGISKEQTVYLHDSTHWRSKRSVSEKLTPLSAESQTTTNDSTQNKNIFTSVSCYDFDNNFLGNFHNVIALPFIINASEMNLLLIRVELVE